MLVGYVDSNPAKRDETKGVYSPELIAKHKDATVVIMSDKIKEIATFIRDSGWNNEILVFPHLRSTWCDRNQNELRNWCAENKSKLFSVYENDDYTTGLLQEMLIERASDTFSFVPLERVIDFSHINLYFYDEEIAPKGDITLVNGGAYTGDSIEEIFLAYGDRLKKVYAFEPDSENMSALKVRMNKLGIANIVENVLAGMSDHEDKIAFSGGESMASAFLGNGEESVPIVTIDSVVKEVAGELCINMDVEGFEVPAIKGAKDCILKYHPYLAICVYHKMGDFLDVPMAIKSIRDDYKFYLRSGAHPECYAVPIR